MALPRAILFDLDDTLIRAYAQAAARYLQVQLWIAGEGPQRPALEAITMTDLFFRPKSIMNSRSYI